MSLMDTYTTVFDLTIKLKLLDLLQPKALIEYILLLFTPTHASLPFSWRAENRGQPTPIKKAILIFYCRSTCSGSQVRCLQTFFIWMWSLARPQTLVENRGRAYAIIWALFSWIFRISIAKSTYLLANKRQNRYVIYNYY